MHLEKYNKNLEIMAIYTEQIDPNKSASLEITNKEFLIEEINSIIKEYGSFTVADVEAEFSPTIPHQKGNLIHLIEGFNPDRVEVEVYGDYENSIDSYILTYKQLEEETLESILELAQKWAEINEE